MSFNFENINSITKNYKFRRFLLYLCITLLTFVGGAITASFWFVSLQNVQSETEAADAKPIETKFQKFENHKPEQAVQNYYQLSESERSYRTDHTVRPRAQHSDIIGRLAEFVELFGKSRTNTFYISKVESDDDGNPETNDEYVYAYWKENGVILELYPPFNIEDVTYYSWVYGMRNIDLAKDVVETEEEIGGSNYLVTKAFVNELLDKCVKHGVKVTIDKTKFKK